MKRDHHVSLYSFEHNMRTSQKDDDVHVKFQGRPMTETVLNFRIQDGGAATYSPFLESRIHTSSRSTLRLICLLYSIPVGQTTLTERS
jgi:hypothetical protein